jgi:hypothetical protein
LQLLQSTAPAQTNQDTQAEKPSKAKKSKKSTEATSKQAAAPATVGEKTSKPKKSKKSATDATPSQSAAPMSGEKTAPAKRQRKSASDTTSSGSANRAQSSEDKQAAPAPVRTASRAEIQSAKSGGKVWVNTDSGVYHKSGQWYGATKQGKFMTEQDAIRAGYKPAKNEK